MDVQTVTARMPLGHRNNRPDQPREVPAQLAPKVPHIPGVLAPVKATRAPVSEGREVRRVVCRTEPSELAPTPTHGPFLIRYGNATAVGAPNGAFDRDWCLPGRNSSVRRRIRPKVNRQPWVEPFGTIDQGNIHAGSKNDRLTSSNKHIGGVLIDPS
jgi:hypothetical protein